MAHDLLEIAAFVVKHLVQNEGTVEVVHDFAVSSRIF
jgi:hypothetical protein